jgi:uncharacterized protein YqeY
VPQPLSKDELKRVFKEAIKEWLDQQFAQFGKWSLKTIGAMLLAALVYAYFTTGGFKH